MRLRGIKNHGTVVLHHHYRKASGHQWNPNWEQDDSFRRVRRHASSDGVMVISSGTQQKEQTSSAEFCGFTFILLSQIICHNYITLYVYNCIYIYRIYIYICIISFWDVIFWVLLGWFHGTNPTLCLSLCASETLSSCQSHCNGSSTTAKEDHILLEPRRNPLRFLQTGVNPGSGNGNGW